MKKILKISGIGLCFAGLLAASSAQATLTFDENGNSSGGVSGVIHQQVADTLWATANGKNVASGGGVTTLDYLTPYTGTTPVYGWVAIYDAGTPSSDFGTTTGLSDLIHFDNSHVVNGVVYLSMFFYSIDSGSDLADNWISSTLTYANVNNIPAADVGKNVLATILSSSDNIAFALEDGSGNAFYDASSTTSPGYQGADTKYEFMSSVPEASTVIAGALLLLPLGASTLRILRKNRA